MIQLEKILPSWEISNSAYPRRLYDPQMDLVMGDLDLTFLSTSPEESSVISSNSITSTMLSNEFFDLSNSNEFFDLPNSNEFFHLPNLGDQIPIASPMEGLETISSGEISDICGWINGSDCNENVTKLISMDGDEYSPCFSLDSSENSTVFPLRNGSNTFPGDMEMNNEISLHHLLRAYGEAIENTQTELAQVIVNSIAEKRNLNPLGTIMERLAFYLFDLEENYIHYLRQESVKNFSEAFKAFYQGLPYGRFAHFTANSAILESIPNDATTVHIVDFDIGEGIQWPSLIEAISRRNRALKFTLIKSSDEISPPHWDIEWTKKRLQDHAREFNLMLQIDEKRISDLANEVTRMRKRGQGREWLVFNCMFRLPHTAGMRQRSHANEFLKVAKEILTSYGASAGMVTLGYGETEISSETCSGYSSFFDELLKHYQSIFESLEQSFPVHLAEARTALESLFLAPHINSLSWFQEWEELKEASNLQLETGLEDMKVSHESLIEAKQIVNNRDNGYNVKITGERKNEMVLEWKGTALVKVSTWMQRSN